MKRLKQYQSFQDKSNLKINTLGVKQVRKVTLAPSILQGNYFWVSLSTKLIMLFSGYSLNPDPEI